MDARLQPARRRPTVHSNPAREGFTMPAEWEPHEATWVAWPAAADLWLENLAGAQTSFTALCAAIADPQDGRPAEQLRVLVTDERAESDARAALQGLGAELVRIRYGDIWLRDTAPLFLSGRDGELATVRFRFNGWGGKYVLAYDEDVASTIADRAGVRAFTHGLVLEGGSVELDGEGTCLTTRQCLLNSNRNPGLDQTEIEAALSRTLGVGTVLWLDRGLLNDHTDGHIDTLVRFVAPGVVVCMTPADDDPNREVLLAIIDALGAMRDHRGRALRVVTVPSPGRVLDPSRRVMPASYVNFYIANRTVAVPTYGVANDEAAVAAVADLFPGRRTVGIPAKAILAGGGAFHCITQQQPRPRG
jgi:agmatine deiminase